MSSAIFPQSKASHLWHGSSLVAGTAIGGGMLAIPLYTYQAGFFWACLTSLLSWACLTATGLALCRLLAISPDGLCFLTLVRRWLGPFWLPATSALFMGMLWLLLVAYSSGGGSLMALEGLPPAAASLLFVAPLTLVLARGRQSTAQLNAVLFALMLFVGLSFVLLAGSQWRLERLIPATSEGSSACWAALPVLFAAFGFHNVLPSVRLQVGPDLKALSWAVVLGTTLALVLVVGWQALVFGCLSPAQLAQAARLGQPVTCALGAHSGLASLVAAASAVFAYLAMATSFLGVAQGGIEVLRGGTEQDKRPWLLVLLVGSAWLCSLWRPDLFGQALSLAGGMGVGVLNGALPVALLLAAARRGALVLTRLEKMAWVFIGLLSLGPAFLECWC
jgi:tyrosine-specific transport protein